MQTLSRESKTSLRQAADSYHAQMMTDGGGQGALAYLEDRGLGAVTSLQDVTSRYRLGVVLDPVVPEHEQFRGRLCIPYLTQAGVVQMKFRCLEDHSCKEEKCDKYVGLPGQGARIYNVSALFRAGDTICVCEGELDALVLDMLGAPAVGIPGAEAWKKHYKYVLNDFTRVVAFCDGDDAGRKFGSLLREKVAAVTVQCPQGMDVNSVYLSPNMGPEWLLHKAGAVNG